MDKELLNQIKSTLRDNGFSQYTSCNCSGVYTEKYKNLTNWRVNLCPYKGTFFVIKHGVAVAGKKINQFNEVFTKYLQEIQAEA
jgi:hypothetical protein